MRLRAKHERELCMREELSMLRERAKHEIRMRWRATHERELTNVSIT